MSFPDRLRLCFFGKESGVGKSTAGALAYDYLSFEIKTHSVYRLNVAQPLHDIQSFAYQRFNLESTGQDGRLLQFLAAHFQARLGPTFQANLDHLESLATKTIIINSDCRNNTYPVLKDRSFIFIEVLRPRPIARIGDSSQFNKDHPVEFTSQIVPDLRLDNSGTLEDLRPRLTSLLHHLQCNYLTPNTTSTKLTS